MNFQTEIMKLLSEIPTLYCPKIIPTKTDNSYILKYNDHFARLIEYVDGVLFIDSKFSGDSEFLYRYKRISN